MASNRGRNLEFSLLSDLEKFRLEEPARDLETLGDAADDTGRRLDDLEENARRTSLDDTVGRDAKEAARTMDASFDDIASDAQTAARKVDSAFDDIARSSKGTARKLDDDTDKINRSLEGVGDEASGTAREMAASFDGSKDSVLDAFQELGANAGESFGPVGVAVGVAATVGVGLIRAEAEKLKELAGGMVEEMIEAGGRLNEEAINAKIELMASDDPAEFIKMKRIIDDLGLSWGDFARAKAGDAEAAERSITAIADLSTELTENAAAAGSADGAMYAQQVQLNDLAGQIGTTAKAYGIAKEAVEATADATGASLDPMAEAKSEWRNLRGSLSDPITGQVRVSTPSRGALAAVRRDLADGIGPIIVDVLPSSTPAQFRVRR